MKHGPGRSRGKPNGGAKKTSRSLFTFRLTLVNHLHSNERSQAHIQLGLQGPAVVHPVFPDRVDKPSAVDLFRDERFAAERVKTVRFPPVPSARGLSSRGAASHCRRHAEPLRSGRKNTGRQSTVVSSDRREQVYRDRNSTTVFASTGRLTSSGVGVAWTVTRRSSVSTWIHSGGCPAESPERPR